VSPIMVEALPKISEPWHILDGPGSIGPAVHVRSRTAPPFNLRAAMRRLGISHFANWKNLPQVGDQRGDRAELERVMIGTFPLTAGVTTIITKDIPVGDPWLILTINFRGQLNSVATPTGTVVTDAPLQLWKIALTTDLDKDVVEAGTEIRALFRYAQFLQGTQGDINTPVITASTVTDFNVALQILMVDPRMMVPEDTILDTRRYNTITISISTGQLTDIVITPVNVTLQGLNADVAFLRVSPRVPMPLDIVKSLATYKRYAPLTPPNDFITNLDRIPTLAVKRYLWFSSAGAQVVAGAPFTGAGVDTVIDTFRVSSNIRDHFGSAIGGYSRRVLRNDNKLDYSIETWPTGWFVDDMVLDKSILSALATGNLSVLQSILAYQSGLPATPQVSIMQAGLSKLRGVRAR